MKIEKLTENKIRIILNIEDLEENHINLESVLNNSPESQTLLLSLLNKAENEIGFYTRDSKILIEAFSFPEGVFILTITKCANKSQQDLYTIPNTSYKKRVTPKRKCISPKNFAIYSFCSFDDFCEFCSAVNSEFFCHIDISSFSRNSSLYFYNNTYFLLIPLYNITKENLDCFFSVVSEFVNQVDFSSNFESKLIEHGQLIFSKNAISKTIDIFIKHKKRQI